MNSLFEQGYHGMGDTMICDRLTLTPPPPARRHPWSDCASSGPARSQAAHASRLPARYRNSQQTAF